MKPQSKVYREPLPFKISLRDTSFHIYLNSLGFYLSRMLVQVSLTYIFQNVGEKIFNLWCSHSLKMHWIYHFYSFPSPPLKTPSRIFWKPVSPKMEGVEEAKICPIKIQSESMKLTWNISLFSFCMICNFSKCDGFTVFWIISIKSNSVVLSLLPLLCNHANLTLKLQQKQ